MATELFLAMTASEFMQCPSLPPNPAWMACHFSPYGTGLSNLPGELPQGAMVILNDRTPVSGHDPDRIAQQLSGLGCSRILLDFERQDESQTAAIVERILDTLPCPVGVSEHYARDSAWPIFLPPIPPHISPGDYLAPWQGREVWLEAALNTVCLTVTAEGCQICPADPPEKLPHRDSTLFCHYQTEVSKEQIRFTLHRTPEDLTQLLEEVRQYGVTLSVGLYQELGYMTEMLVRNHK